jgi:hypothetical protein
MTQTKLLLRGSLLCLLPSPYRSAASSLTELDAATMQLPLPKPSNSPCAPCGICCNGSAANPTNSSPATVPDPADLPTSKPSTTKPWLYASNIPIGGPATSVFAWPTRGHRQPCPANAPYNAGFANSNSPQPLEGVGRTLRPRGPARPMNAGKWMPWTSYARAAARGSLGCDWWTSAVGPSWTPGFSPQYHWVHVPDTAVQAQLRQAFTCWGLPGSLRVDNGAPWGSWSDLPPPLALWLIGLGIAMLWNPPRRPQDNGVVERSQGTGKRWAEPHRCRSAAQLQERLTADDRLQRERYPHHKKRSRCELYPGLAHSGRAYQLADEDRLWDLGRVGQHLAEYAVPRKVDGTGQVSLYNRNYYVGVVHKGNTVYVMFDPGSSEWLFADSAGKQLRSKPAVEITAERIRTLNLKGKK